MQLSVSTRQAGHGEIENHISGNGKCLTLLPRIFLFVWGHQEGCGEDGIGDAICSHAEENSNKEQHAGWEADAKLMQICVRNCWALKEKEL